MKDKGGEGTRSQSVLGPVNHVKGLGLSFGQRKQLSRFLFCNYHSACAVENRQRGAEALGVWRPMNRLL